MADSSLVTYEDYNVPYTSGRTSGVGCICVHHMAGNLDAAGCARVWRNSGAASAHYAIDSNGNIGQLVHESDCAWACGNKSINNCSISIECANDGGASTDWHVSDATINACINLLVDICTRLGWKEFRYTGSPYTGELFAHREVVATACPGNYLYSKFSWIAEQVQKRLNGEEPQPTNLYRVRKSWDDAKTQKGAFKNLDKAKKCADKNAGYKVFDPNGNCVYDPQSKGGLDVDGDWGTATTTAVQKWLGTDADGIVSNQMNSNKEYLTNCNSSSWEFEDSMNGGSDMIRALQKKIGADVDGYAGVETVTKLQKFLNDAGYNCGEVDGVCGTNTVSALQKFLNAR